MHRPHVRKRKHYQVDNTAPASQPSGERRIYKRSSEAGLSTTSPQETLTPSQQASYLGRSNYITAHVDIDEDDATQYRSPAPPPTGPLHEFQKKIRRNLTGIELPQGPLRQTLLRNFLQRCRPWMPLVNESDLEKFDAKNSDSLLVTAMLVAGSIVSSAPQVAQIGQRCYQRAKVLFYTGAEQNHLYTVMATIFLQWLNPSGPEHVSIDNSSFWLRISVGLAHQLGLHREPNPRMADAKLRRKMWWALIVRYQNQKREKSLLRRGSSKGEIWLIFVESPEITRSPRVTGVREQSTWKTPTCGRFGSTISMKETKTRSSSCSLSTSRPFWET